MRAFLGLSTLALLAATSCEKAKDLLKSAPESATVSTASAVPIAEIDAASYESFTQSAGRLAVVEFGAEWCGVCKAMEPVLVQVAAEFPATATVAKIDVDHSKAFAKSENVTVLPEYRFYRDGKQVERILGEVEPGKLREAFKKHTSGLQAPEAGKSDEAAAPPSPTISRMKKDWVPPGLEKR